MIMAIYFFPVVFSEFFPDFYPLRPGDRHRSLEIIEVQRNKTRSSNKLVLDHVLLHAESSISSVSCFHPQQSAQSSFSNTKSQSLVLSFISPIFPTFCAWFGRTENLQKLVLANRGDRREERHPRQMGCHKQGSCSGSS